MDQIALHVSPHPDDEVLGCGATLLGLQRAGWRIVNLTCSLGRPADRSRREQELDRALDVLGFEGMVVSPPVALSAGDDLVRAETRIRDAIEDVAAAVTPALVLAPHPGEAHHGHAVVGRAVAAAAPARSWWAWGLWRDLPRPNRYVPYGDEDLARLSTALAHHTGELARNAYADLLPARARARAIIGSERVLGFGSGPAAPQPYADLFEERVRRGPTWRRRPGPAVGLGPWIRSPAPEGHRR